MAGTWTTRRGDSATTRDIYIYVYICMYIYIYIYIYTHTFFLCRNGTVPEGEEEDGGYMDDQKRGFSDHEGGGEEGEEGAEAFKPKVKFRIRDADAPATESGARCLKNQTTS